MSLYKGNNLIAGIIPDAVSKAGDTMSGALTVDMNLQDPINTPIVAVGSDIDITTTPASNLYPGLIQINDSNSLRMGRIEYQQLVNGEHGISMVAKVPNQDTYASVTVGFNSNNVAFATAPTPANGITPATNIATTQYVANYAEMSSFSTLPIPAHQGTIQAPSDGYMCFIYRLNTTGSYMGLYNQTIGIGSYTASTAANHLCRVFIPCNKGNSIFVEYSSSSTTTANNSLRYLKFLAAV